MLDEEPPDAPGQTTRPSDRDLLARFRAGDREAFTLIYRAHGPALFRFATHMSGDSMKGAEITQDVFVWLIHHPDHFDEGRGNLGALLTGVARRILLKRWQNERRWLPLEAAGKKTATPPAIHEARSDSRAMRLRELIAGLPPRYREVVVLCDLEAKTYEETALILECAVGTVRSRLHRARGLLGRKLQSEKEKLECGV